jgi:hypothetical protein
MNKQPNHKKQVNQNNSTTCLYHHRRFGIENLSATSPKTRNHNKAAIHIDAYADTGFEFVSDLAISYVTKTIAK